MQLNSERQIPNFQKWRVPKVSIGMPVYNGEKYIREALNSLLTQTYTDFELIISDNASTDKTEEICKEYAGRDIRIKYFRQPHNKGAFFNFNFVLKQSRGEYFMWAAHDDTRDPLFIEKIMNRFLESDKTVVAIACETQYTIGLDKQSFFLEGEPFYNKLITSPEERIKYVIKNNYGNLMYSIFKRDCMYIKGETILTRLHPVSLNEVPIFILVAQAGNWLVIPEVLFFKETNKGAYKQLVWERVGGKLTRDKSPIYIKYMIYNVAYHVKALIDMQKSIGLLNFSVWEKVKLKIYIFVLLVDHWFKIIIGRQ